MTELVAEAGHWFLDKGVLGVGLGASLGANFMLFKIVIQLLGVIKDNSEAMKDGKQKVKNG